MSASALRTARPPHSGGAESRGSRLACFWFPHRYQPRPYTPARLIRDVQVND